MDKIFREINKQLEEIRTLSNKNMNDICDLSVRIDILSNAFNALLQIVKKIK